MKYITQYTIAVLGTVVFFIGLASFFALGFASNIYEQVAPVLFLVVGVVMLKNYFAMGKAIRAQDEVAYGRCAFRGLILPVLIIALFIIMYNVVKV